VIRAQIGVRALVAPPTCLSPKRPHKPGGRIAPYGQRVLVFDTETTSDFSQKLLFGFFLLVAGRKVELEGAILPTWVPAAKRKIIERELGPPPTILTPEQFVEDLFYPEVWDLGALCVGFNLPFDLSRLAVRAACGRGEHRRAFSLTMTNRYWLPRIRIESISSKAAFIQFVPATRKGRRIFPGRFLDLRTLTSVFTGRSHSLRSACDEFQTSTGKIGLDEYGAITAESAWYGRNDVRATYALYEQLVAEYSLYGFATFQNEFEQTR
jgi:hypothetical protein